jgi:hypothetical protein
LNKEEGDCGLMSMISLNQGLFAKAEALFAGGDFEYALMFYHRGNHLRPSEEFRLGIQKSEQAIRDSIGTSVSFTPRKWIELSLNCTRVDFLFHSLTFFV